MSLRNYGVGSNQLDLPISAVPLSHLSFPHQRGRSLTRVGMDNGGDASTNAVTVKNVPVTQDPISYSECEAEVEEKVGEVEEPVEHTRDQVTNMSIHSLTMRENRSTFQRGQTRQVANNGSCT